MGAVTSLAERTLAVDPGGSVAVELTVRNNGGVVDQFPIEVLGDPGQWSTADPPRLSLFPGAQGTSRITFSPPRSSAVRAGSVDFGIRVSSTEDPAGSSVEEGTLQVGAFLAAGGELVPRTSHGSRAGRHDLAVDNRGNARLQAALSGTDPDRLVRFSFDPESLPVEPGDAAFAKVLVKPVRTFWRGAPKSRPFQLALQPDAAGSAPIVLEGTYLQESILPSWFVRAFVALIGLLAAAVLAWIFLLQPAIKSTAADTLANFGFTPKPGSSAAGGGSGGGGGGGGASPSPATSGTVSVTPPPGGGQGPVDGRLDTSVNALTPTSGTLSITDLVFSNPTGASGDLTLQRTSASGSTQLLVLRLENFRDLDFHFVTPITVHAGETLALVANCTAPTGPTTTVPTCSPAVFYSGYVTGS